VGSWRLSKQCFQVTVVNEWMSRQANAKHPGQPLWTPHTRLHPHSKKTVWVPHWERYCSVDVCTFPTFSLTVFKEWTSCPANAKHPGQPLWILCTRLHPSKKTVWVPHWERDCSADVCAFPTWEKDVSSGTKRLVGEGEMTTLGPVHLDLLATTSARRARSANSTFRWAFYWRHASFVGIYSGVLLRGDEFELACSHRHRHLHCWAKHLAKIIVCTGHAIGRVSRVRGLSCVLHLRVYWEDETFGWITAWSMPKRDSRLISR